MKAQGFEYLLPPPPEYIIPLSDLTDILEEAGAMDRGSSEFRRRFGYGVSTIDAYLDTYSGNDPNRARLKTMSAAEQRAWDAALYGPELAKWRDPEYEPTPEELSGEVSIDLEIGGCEKEAAEAAGVTHNVYEQDTESDVELRGRIYASVEYVELEQEWFRCAADQGFDDLTWAGSGSGLVYDKLEAIRAPAPWDDLTFEEWASMSEDDLWELYESMGPLYSLEELAVVQQEELEIAARLEDCDAAYWTGYDELEDRLRPAAAGEDWLNPDS